MKNISTLLAILLLACVISAWAVPAGAASNETADRQTGNVSSQNVHPVVSPAQIPGKVKNIQPSVDQGRPFTCRAGQYENLGKCVSDCQPGGKQDCVAICKACVRAPVVIHTPEIIRPTLIPVPKKLPAVSEVPFTCRAGQYPNLGQCVSDCQAGGKQNCELTCKACVRVTVTPVPTKVQPKVTPTPQAQPVEKQTPFSCRAGQYRNLGQCVSDCQSGGKQSCELTCKACIGPTEPASGLALLVRNANALDVEENNALQFIRARGRSITPVDAAMVKSQAGVLSGFQGFWAASDTQPVEWKDPVALTALRGELAGGKRLFMMAGSMYLGQYLGYGTAGIDAWGPCVLDAVYFVDNQGSTHPVLAGFSSWIPPSKPDNPDQLFLKLRKTGGWSHFTFRGNNEIAVQATGLWVRYGFATGSPSPYPVLDARYGITSTGERFLFSFPIFREVTVGQGSIGYPGLVIHLTREWGLGPMGEKLFTNQITWVLGE